MGTERQMHVTWKNLAQEQPEREGPYLIVNGMTDNSAGYEVAEWMKEGSSFRLHKAKPYTEEEQKAMSDEERLLYAIFGEAEERFEVEEDGFYRITSDFGTDEEKYPGCKDILVSYGTVSEGENTWWSGLPNAPEGLTHPETAARVREQAEEDRQQERAQKQRELEKTLRVLTEPNGYVDKQMKNTGEKRYDWLQERRLSEEPLADVNGEMHEGCVEDITGVLLEYSELGIRRAYAAAAQSVETAMAFWNEYSDEEIMDAHDQFIVGNKEPFEKMFEEAVRTIKEHDHASLMVDPTRQIQRRFGKYEMTLALILINAPYRGRGIRDVHWWNAHFKRRQWFKEMPWQERLMYSSISSQLMPKVARTVNLARISAPAPIMTHAVMLLAEYWMYLLLPVKGFTDSFPDLTGYNLDGTWAGYDGESDGSLPGEEDGDDGDIPPIPDDLPKVDYFGDLIPYAYNPDTEEWEDERSQTEIAGIERAIGLKDTFLDSLYPIFEGLGKVKYPSVQDYITLAKEAFRTKAIGVERAEDRDGEILFQLAKPIDHFHQCVVIALVDGDRSDGFRPGKADMSSQRMKDKGWLGTVLDEDGNLVNNDPHFIIRNA